MPEAKVAAGKGEKVKATRMGTVVKTAMKKTITVEVEYLVQHSAYKKIVRRNRTFLVHDEHSAAGVGDVVRIVECRPRSKQKRWRLLEIISKAK